MAFGEFLFMIQMPPFLFHIFAASSNPGLSQRRCLSNEQSQMFTSRLHHTHWRNIYEYCTHSMFTNASAIIWDFLGRSYNWKGLNHKIVDSPVKDAVMCFPVQKHSPWFIFLLGQGYHFFFGGGGGILSESKIFSVREVWTIFWKSLDLFPKTKLKS